MNQQEESEGQCALRNPERDPWIFRDGVKKISGQTIVRQLGDQIRRGASGTIDALIQAGELEAALADAGHPCAVSAAALTDELASVLCSADQSHLLTAKRLLAEIKVPEFLNISPPEGFSYYALHPLDFARVTAHIPRNAVYAVVGIRSIGATLSAVTATELRLGGYQVSRTTVRPTGHPYSRMLELNREQTDWVRESLSRLSHFVIVDEGPGRSGSTFLSVAEALLQAGVPRDKITIVGSRWPDPASLCANNAAARWTSFHFVSTSPSAHSRFENYVYAGGGCWRDVLEIPLRHWPESWVQMERLKFISPDRRTLFKFEGMGRIGSEVRDRAFSLAQAGFGPGVRDAGDGFMMYELLPGRPLTARDLNDAVLDRMAQYCAFRLNNFGIDGPASNQLQQMVEFNVQQEFGIQLSFSLDEFASATPVVTDGRMQPHEWIAIADDRLVKTDGADHGDNHFFPGPCDIAWDLAGIAVEWDLSKEALNRFLTHFNKYSGKDVSGRIAAYTVAYAIFRLGFCRMALSTAQSSAEERRLRTAAGKYQIVAKGAIEAMRSTTERLPIDLYQATV